MKVQLKLEKNSKNYSFNSVTMYMSSINDSLVNIV